MNASYGMKCLEQFAKFNRVGLWQKMFSELLLLTGDWCSNRCVLRWKIWATKFSRLSFRLQAYNHVHIKGNGCGLLPTPMADDYKGSSDINAKDRSVLKSTLHKLNIGVFQTGGENYISRSKIHRMDDGISQRLDGITFHKWRSESTKAYGNAIVPQIALQIFKAIENYDLRNQAMPK